MMSTRFQRVLCLCLFLAAAAVMPLCPAASSAEFFISPEGNDAWSGTVAAPGDADGPFRTLERARDAVRALKASGALPDGGVTVTLRGGVYPRAASFELGSADSGAPGAPVVYRAYPDEEPRLLGGRVVRDFAPVKAASVLARLDEGAREHVVAADLPAQGITDFGKLVNSGYGLNSTTSHLELFIGDTPMRLAEWPNQDWTLVAGVPEGRQIIDGAGKKRGMEADSIEYTGERPRRWKSLDDVFAHGYWTYDWADVYLRVKSIDLDKHIVTFTPPQSGYGYKKGQRFRFLNVLEELDAPGEYYLDRNNGMLYCWPPVPITDGAATVSMLTSPLVSLDGASDLRFERLTFECARGQGVVIKGGCRAELAGCVVRNLGLGAIHIDGGTEHAVRGCNLYGLGEGGIEMSGGDTKTLTPGGHVAGDNDIHDYSRWQRTYCPAVRFSGVGNVARNNFIHDAPHAGILLGGNNHVIELNEITRVCVESGDVGGFYMGRHWEYRGNVVRNNYFHHLGGLNMGSNAVYLDDCASGTLVEGNIFYKVWRGMMLGGGRDNKIVNNVFADGKIGIHIDARGLGWARPLIESNDGGWDIRGRLNSVDYKHPPYSTQYPELVNMLEDEPLAPKGNSIARNIHVGPKWLEILNPSRDQPFDMSWIDLHDNFTEGDPGFVDLANGDFHIREDSPVWKLGFKPIPIERIGLRDDAIRRKLPQTQNVSPR